MPTKVRHSLAFNLYFAFTFLIFCFINEKQKSSMLFGDTREFACARSLKAQKVRAEEEAKRNVKEPTCCQKLIRSLFIIYINTYK